MSLLVAAVALLGVLVLLDLLLTFAVIRRLRTHADLIGEALGSPRTPARVMLEAGQKVGEFSARTTADEQVSLAGLTLVGFFSAHCGTCAEKLPAFLARAATLGRARTLAVVQHGEKEPTADLVAELSDAALVVVEPEDGPLGRAFDVQAVPAMCLLDAEGRVLASGFDTGALPDPVAT
ncbi:TlpA family protein disulfide reductase [Amycolatopsis magusensis]|uniref:TlpA family protein disulfide reductase n=1 Tax=Amycolatopsis magusensis TaxID=882444 RepID=UPI0024A98123|nr:hypothetical protein [Amycolatopsis magusensis]MDI5982177.1 hypothetical protein [Amycolatopsis magusensis]